AGDEGFVALARPERPEVRCLESAALRNPGLVCQPVREPDHRGGDVDPVDARLALTCDRDCRPPRSTAELEAVRALVDEAGDHGVPAVERACAKERVDRGLQL